MELFSQDGVLLKQAHSYYIQYFNESGTLYITEYANTKDRFIEWKPNSVTVHSDSHDSEWSFVNAIYRGEQMSPQPPDSKPKYIKLDMNQVRSFKVSKKNDTMTFFDGKGEILCHFFFQHGNCFSLFAALKGLLKTTVSKRDKNIHIIVDETLQLNKSFATLDLFQDSQSASIVWGFVRSFQEKPVETAFGAFAKIGNTIGNNFMPSSSPQPIEEEVITNDVKEYERGVESSDGASPKDYEIIHSSPELPSRLQYPRGNPLSYDQWTALQDSEGRIEDVEYTKLHIFRGGIAPSLRKVVWKYMLDFYPWNSSNADRKTILGKKEQDYYDMKLQWKTLKPWQLQNFVQLRDRLSLVEKDVTRTDRTLPFYAGDNNKNLQAMSDILMTYVMHNFDLGYVQGMSDLLSPILYLLQNEVDAFWCFAGFMERVCTNFDADQAGMKTQLSNLYILLKFSNPTLASYLDNQESGNMFFCFRWLLVLFKREFELHDVFRLWEVVWTNHPCNNFHLLISIAILEKQQSEFIGEEMGFNEILKHVNDLSGKLDVNDILDNAEGLYYQIRESSQLTNEVRQILGLPLIAESSPKDDSTDSIENELMANVDKAYENGLHTSYF